MTVWSAATLAAAIGCAGPRAAAPRPATARELSVRASAAYSRKQYRECGGWWEEAVTRARHRDPLLSINAACCWALGGDRAHAFAALERALADGAYRPEALADGDLASLHDDPRWPAVLAGVRRNRDQHLATANPLLLQLYEQDQADRQGDAAKIDWKAVGARDQARQAQARALVDGGAARVSADFYHAAMIFQHAHEVADLAFAHRLALRAVELDGDNLEARWLAAATEDRWLMRAGKPQRYGTQKVRKDGRWMLYPVDPAVTDEEREQWNVPSLEEARGEVDQLNGR